MNMCTPPIMMREANICQGPTPSNIKLAENWLSYYFSRYLIQKLMGVFEVKLPTGDSQNSVVPWAHNYFWYCLFNWGYFAIFDTDKWGAIMQQCAPGGYNIFYQPYYCYVTNPLLANTDRRLIIGKDCVLVQMTPDYGGISDLIGYYAGLLAVISQTTTINLLNSKLSYVFAVKNRNSAESCKKLYDQISAGQPANIIDKKLLDENGNPNWLLFNQNVGQNYIVDKLLDAWQTVENKFSTDIGLPNANTTKRERLLVDEVNANNVETQATAGMWLANIKRGFEEANKMFGLNLSIDWKVKPEVVNSDRLDNNVAGDTGRTTDTVR